MRILMSNLYYLTSLSGKPQGPGYIYVNGDSIEGHGLGDPPPSMEEADLVLSGQRLVALPAPVLAPVICEEYPHRLVDNPLEYWRNLSGEQAYYATLMCLYELSLNGVSEALVYTGHPVEAYRASKDAGLVTTLLVPVGNRGLSIDAVKNFIDTTKTKVVLLVTSRDLVEEAERITTTVVSWEDDEKPYLILDDEWVMIKHRGEVIAVASRLQYNPWIVASKFGVEVFEKTYKSIIGVNAGRIEKGFKANIAVVDLSEPPCWIPHPKMLKPLHLASSKPRIALLLSRGTPIVDNELSVYIGSSKALEASRILYRQEEV